MLRNGDIFCVRGADVIGGAIRWVTKLQSSDNESEYNHCGIITDTDGSTFEAVLKYSRQNLFASYHGYEVLIGRHVDMTPERFNIGFAKVAHLEGQSYPFLRILLHFSHIGAKYIHFGKPVCSELVWMFLNATGMKDCDYYWGMTPDDVADAIDKWDVFDVVYSDVL